MNEKKYTQFCLLIERGETKARIMEIMGLGQSSFYNYLNYRKREQDKKNLTPETYYARILQGFTSKEELAEYFGTTRMTLHRHEVEWGSCARISRGLFVTGVTPEKIARILRIKQGVTEIGAHIDGLPNLQNVLETLDAVIEALKDFAAFDYYVTRKISKLEKSRDLISSCIDLNPADFSPAK